MKNNRLFSMWEKRTESSAATCTCPDVRPPLPTLVILHGFKGFKDWGFFPYAAEFLANRGFAVITFNFSMNGVGQNLLDFTELDKFARNTYSREQENVAKIIGEIKGGAPAPGRSAGSEPAGVDRPQPRRSQQPPVRPGGSGHQGGGLPGTAPPMWISSSEELSGKSAKRGRGTC